MKIRAAYRRSKKKPMKKDDEVAEDKEEMDGATGADVKAELTEVDLVESKDSTKVEQNEDNDDEKGLEEEVREYMQDSKEASEGKGKQVTVNEKDDANKEEASNKKEGGPKNPVENGRGTALKDIHNVSFLAKVMQAARNDKKMSAESCMASTPQSARTEEEAPVQENRETQTVSHDEILEGLLPCVMESKNESSSSKSKNTSFKKSKANPPEFIAEDSEERADLFAADLETVEVLMRMKNINSTIRLKTKLDVDTANPNPMRLVNPWDFFDVPMEEKEHVSTSTTHSPQFCPDWSLKINDQVFDLEVARTWVRESVLPRDAKLAEKLSEVDLVNLAYSSKASGHVWDNEVYRRVLDFPARTEKLRSDLAKANERIILVDAAHEELKEKRDADAKIIEKMKSYTLDLKNEKNKLASELSEVKFEKEKLLKRVEEAENSVLEVDNLKVQVAELMKIKNEFDRLIPLHEQALKETAETAARSAELNYKTSDRFAEELSVLIAPMMNHGYTLALDAAKKLRLYVDPENPLVSEFYRPGQDAEFESRVDELRTGVNVVAKYLNPPSGEESDVVATYLRVEEAKLENISTLALPAAQDSDNQIASSIENLKKELEAFRLLIKKSDDFGRRRKVCALQKHASKKTPTVMKSADKGKNKKAEEKENASEEEKSKQKHTSKKTPAVKKSVEKVEEKVNESAADSKEDNSKQKHASTKTPTMKKSVENARSVKVEEKESEEEKSKRKHLSKEILSDKKSVEKAKSQKVKVSEKSPKPNAPPSRTDKRPRDSEITSSNPIKSKKQKTSTPKKSASKEITAKMSEKVNSKSEEGIWRPSDDQLKQAVCEVLKVVDFNTATFTDILRQLAKNFNTDLTSRKLSIKLIMLGELSRLRRKTMNS